MKSKGALDESPEHLFFIPKDSERWRGPYGKKDSNNKEEQRNG